MIKIVFTILVVSSMHCVLKTPKPPAPKPPKAERIETRVATYTAICGQAEWVRYQLRDPTLRPEPSMWRDPVFDLLVRRQ